MMLQEINVSVDRKLKISLDERWLKNIVRKSLEVEGIVTPAEVGLVITDTETVQKLNRNYRDVDEPTDVLAFPLLPYKGQKSEPLFISPPDGIHHLGEVVVSYPQAAQQAKEHDHSVAQELAVLVIHGVLHLLGYDHELPKEKQRMRSRENEIFRRLGSI